MPRNNQNLARKRADTSKCYFCPRRTDIEAHHIVPKRFNGSDQRENLVGVCERCHAKLERLYDKRFYEKLGIADETGERHAHFECAQHDCSDRAKAKVGAGYVSWYCVDHAAEHIQKHGYSVYETTSGDVRERLEDVDLAEGLRTVDSLYVQLRADGEE